MFGGYGRVYTNEFVNAFSISAQHCMSGFSLIINGLLVYFIATGKGRDIGNYRMLISCFAVNDLIYTVLHFLTYPISETYTDTLMVRAHGPINSIFFLCLYIASYGAAFPLLSAHFVYRALQLKCDQFPHHFRRFLVITIVVTIYSAGSWFLLGYAVYVADDDSRVITRPLMSGVESSPIVHSSETEELYIVGTYWANGTFHGARWKSFGGAAVLLTGFATFYGTIATCTYIIVNHMKTTAMSAATIRLQRQLFKCLIYQTVFPTLTAYFPASFCTFAPIFGFSWPPIAIIMPNFCAMHPLFDGAVVLLNVTEYRKSLFECFSCGKKAEKSQTTSVVSISLASMKSTTSVKRK